MRRTARRVALSWDFDREYLTDAPDYRAVTQSIFVDLFKKGQIVEDLRPNIYDPVEGTTIADAEVERLVAHGALLREQLDALLGLRQPGRPRPSPRRLARRRGDAPTGICGASSPKTSPLKTQTLMPSTP